MPSVSVQFFTSCAHGQRRVSKSAEQAVDLPSIGFSILSHNTGARGLVPGVKVLRAHEWGLHPDRDCTARIVVTIKSLRAKTAVEICVLRKMPVFR